MWQRVLACAMLLLVLGLCGAASGRTVEFTAEARAGESLDRDAGSGLRFCLLPTASTGRNSGWVIRVGPSCQREVPDFSGLATPPFHGPNALEIMAWFFDVGANAPHELHEFRFVTTQAGYDVYRRAQDERSEEFRATLAKVPLAKGTLRITGRKMSPTDGSIEWIRFNVRLEWPGK
jgi:hypothetical protein